MEENIEHQPMGGGDGKQVTRYTFLAPFFLQMNNPLPFQVKTNQGTMTHQILAEDKHAGTAVIPTLLPSWENDLTVGLLWPSFSLSEGTFFSTGGSRATFGELGPEGDSGASSVEYHEKKGEKSYLHCRSQKWYCYDGPKLNTIHKQETARVCVRRKIREFTLCQENTWWPSVQVKEF